MRVRHDQRTTGRGSMQRPNYYLQLTIILVLKKSSKGEIRVCLETTSNTARPSECKQSTNVCAKGRSEMVRCVREPPRPRLTPSQSSATHGVVLEGCVVEM